MHVSAMAFVLTVIDARDMASCTSHTVQLLCSGFENQLCVAAANTG
jgi:hypothetical protein